MLSRAMWSGVPVRRQNQIRSRFLDVSEGRWILPGLMLRFGLLLLAAVRAAFLARTDLVVENLALRHQLSTFVHCGRRPRVGVADRVFWVTLRRVWVRWSEVLLFVQPETVVRWHRAGFRKYWTWLSQHHRREGRPSIGEDLRALILRMAAENPTLGGLRAFTASSECWGSPSPSVRSQGISLVSGQVPARSSGGSNSFAITAT